MKTLKKRLLLIAACFAIFFALNSCFDDLNRISSDIEISPKVLLPAGEAQITLWDLLDDPGNQIFDPNKDTLTIIHTQEDIINFDASEFFEFGSGFNATADQLSIPAVPVVAPPTATQSELDNIANTFLSSDDVFPASERKFFIDLSQAEYSDAKLKEIHLSSLDLNFQILKTMDPNITVTIESEDIVFVDDLGNETNFIKQIEATDTPVDKPINETKETILRPDANNQIKFTYNITLSNVGGNIGASTLDISVNMGKLAFSKIVGYLGQRSLNFDDVNLDLDVEFWDKLGDGFALDAPKIHLIVSTNMGIPIQGNIALKGKSTKSDEIKTSAATIDFPYSKEAGKAVIETKTISNANTVDPLAELISLPPSESFGAGGNIKLNPAGQVVGEDNFITNDANINVDLKAELPMAVKLENLSYRDTSEMSMDDDTVDQLESLKLIFRMRNTLLPDRG